MCGFSPGVYPIPRPPPGRSAAPPAKAIIDETPDAMHRSAPSAAIPPALAEQLVAHWSRVPALRSFGL